MDKLDYFVKQFTQKEIFDKSLLIKQGREWWLVPKQTRSILQTIHKRPEMAGAILAREWGNPEGIKPGRQLLTLLNSFKEIKKVVINNKAEWLAVCGRPVLLESVLSYENAPVKGNLVLVLNKERECLGYGRMMDSKGSAKGIIMMHYDIGDFLRRERNTQQKKNKEIAKLRDSYERE